MVRSADRHRRGTGIVDQIAGSQDAGTTYCEWLEENEESDEPALYGFDLGMNALAAALSAAQCLPFYGCNGGAFDEGHHEAYPLLALFCPTGVFSFIYAAAERAGTGLAYNYAGGLSVFARNVDALIAWLLLSSSTGSRWMPSKAGRDLRPIDELPHL